MIHTRDVAPRALGELLKRQPLSDGKVQLAWTTAVGRSIARASSVRLDTSGTLQVRTDTEAWRREVSRGIPLIKRRMTDLLGPRTVKRISVKRRSP